MVSSVLAAAQQEAVHLSLLELPWSLYSVLMTACDVGGINCAGDLILADRQLGPLALLLVAGAKCC